jgi:hypothetical protein
MVKRSRLSKGARKVRKQRLGRSDVESVSFRGVLLGLRDKKTGEWLIWSYGDDVRFQEFTPEQVIRDPELLDAVAEAEDEGYNLSKRQMFKRLRAKGMVS